jgi:hypothetical protein
MAVEERESHRKGKTKSFKKYHLYQKPMRRQITKKMVVTITMPNFVAIVDVSRLDLIFLKMMAREFFVKD